MYLGIARLLGMAVSDPASSWDDAIADLEASWDHHDYFYLHYKATDSAGEDGDFDRKMAAIELVDSTIPADRRSGTGRPVRDRRPQHPGPAEAATPGTRCRS